MEEIEKTTKKQFKEIVKKSIKQKAFEYLENKRKSKGKEIRYTELKMAEYLQPGYVNITLTEQRGIFSLRNRMIEISENFSTKIKKEKCNCGEELSMKHIYMCVNT